MSRSARVEPEPPAGCDMRVEARTPPLRRVGTGDPGFHAGDRVRRLRGQRYGLLRKADVKDGVATVGLRRGIAGPMFTLCKTTPCSVAPRPTVSHRAQEGMSLSVGADE